MTFAPDTLKALGALWTGMGGVNLGIVGDSAHLAKGWSYHLGKDDLAAGASSARLPRDVAGLTNAASAIDLGKLDGSYPKLREFSTWLVEQGRKNAPGTSDIREIIYSPDGTRVMRWDRERGFASVPRVEGDNSHLTHTHISWYRDAEKRDHTVAFRPYFEVAMNTSDVAVPAKPTLITIPTGTKLFDNDGLVENPNTITVSPGREMPLAWSQSEPRAARVVEYVDDTGTHTSKAMWKAKTAGEVTRLVPVPVLNCDAAVTAAIAADRAKAKVTWT